MSRSVSLFLFLIFTAGAFAAGMFWQQKHATPPIARMDSAIDAQSTSNTATELAEQARKYRELTQKFSNLNEVDFTDYIGTVRLIRK